MMWGADIKCIKIPLIVVYNSPSDYPGYYIARLWDADKPTDKVFAAKTLDEIHDFIPAGMTCFPPSSEDDPVIIETWL